MGKKQFNLYLDETMAEAIRQEAARQNLDGPSAFVRKLLTGYLQGDLEAVQRMLEHVLTRVDKPVDQARLKVIKRLVDSFLLG